MCALNNKYFSTALCSNESATLSLSISYCALSSEPFSINFSMASILRTNASFPESKTAWLNSSFIKSVVDSTDDVRSSVTGGDAPQLIRKLSIMICVKFFMKLSSRP